MRFSKWHALGNTYLLARAGGVERPLEPDDVRRLCDPHRGVGADGVLEIVDIRGPEAEVVVWNPDGSTAELSGNGARIAAMWLARRSGVAFPRLRIGGRTIPARVEGDEVEVDLGEVVVERPEALEVGDERIEVTPVSIGNPHAVDPARALARRAPQARAAGGSARALSRPHERSARPAVSPNDLAVLVWERGAGETPPPGRARRRPPRQPSRTAGARARSAFTSPAARSPSTSARVARSSRPVAEIFAARLRLTELDQAAVGIAEIRRAAPG